MTLEARREASRIELADDGMSFHCVRMFGAPPDRVYRAFTDPSDLRVWFPSGAPAGSEMTVCESEPVEGGRYHYELVIPEYGVMSWHGTYTRVDRADRIDAEEWFVMGDADPEGPPTVQTLTFEPAAGGLSRMTMDVRMPVPEDRTTFMETAAVGLSTSLATMDELVSA